MPTVEVLEDGVAVFHGKDKLNFYLYFLIIIPSKGRVTLIDLIIELVDDAFVTKTGRGVQIKLSPPLE